MIVRFYVVVISARPLFNAIRVLSVQLRVGAEEGGGVISSNCNVN